MDVFRSYCVMIKLKGIAHLQLLVSIGFHSMEKKNSMQVNGDQLKVNYPFNV